MEKQMERFRLNKTAEEINLILNSFDNKVDKIEGKGLSTNDFTTEEKLKIENTYTKEEIDTKLSSSGGGIGQNTEGKTFEDIIINGSEYDYTGTSTAEIFNNYTNNIAAGSYSHAEGNNTRAVSTASHAEGGETTASGNYSHAEGQATYATGDSSHTEGMSTKATNINAHAEGNATTASGKNSHAEGGYTTAKGIYSHAEGRNTTASGSGSHAEGDYAKATNGSSHAEGYYTEANGSSSHAEGKWSIASAAASHAEGTSTKASSENQHTQGRYNVEDTDGKYAFIIGNGDNNTRSNAIAIDWDGKIYVNNAEEGVDISVVNTNISGLNADVSSLNDNISSINDDIDNINSRMVGIRTDVNGAEIFNYNLNEASGEYSHAEGYSTEALGRAAHAEGGDTIASGDYSHASGYHTTAASAYQTVIGQLNNTDRAGKYAFIIGNGYMEDLGTNAYAERRSTGFAIDWDGKIYINNATEGIDLVDLVNRITTLEAAIE
jgi:hypothetical protein